MQVLHNIPRMDGLLQIGSPTAYDRIPHDNMNLVESGCLLWGIRVIIPRTRLQELDKEHLDIARMKSLALSHVWRPKMD